jgi:F-type H+-transporting ATPase subunit delta
MAKLEKPIARRYARAILQIAQEQNALDDVAADLNALGALMDSHLELRHALASPSFKPEQRAAVLDAVMAAGPAGKPAHKVTLSLLRLLVDKDRVPYIPLIAQMFREEADRLVGRVRAEVYSAQALSRDELADVARALEKQAQGRKLGQTVVVTPHVDATLLSGIKAQLGGLVFDGTLKNHLRKMGEELSR